MNVLTTTIVWFLTALEIALFARAILSWVSVAAPAIHGLQRLLYELTEPMLQPIRALIERSIFQGNGNIFDISPLIAFILIDVIKALLS